MTIFKTEGFVFSTHEQLLRILKKNRFVVHNPNPCDCFIGTNYVTLYVYEDYLLECMERGWEPLPRLTRQQRCVSHWGSPSAVCRRQSQYAARHQPS